LTDSGGTTTYTYNQVNEVATITEPGGYQTTYSYNADEQPQGITYPNGITESMSYDLSGRLSVIQAVNGFTTLDRYTYSYANPTTGADTSLRQSVTPLTGTATTYTYDVLNRLTEAKTGTTSDYQYTYDGVGNRWTQTINGATTTSTYNAANEMTQAGTTTFGFDANGARITSSLGLSLVYNNLHQTSSATPPGGSASAMS
jgi:YD repeat-containing protein